MSDITYIGIGEYGLKCGSGLLACSALGSCVGVCLWDHQTRIAGLIHILLPAGKGALAEKSPAKYADSGIELLVKKMERRGANPKRLTAKLVGGACLYANEKPVSSLDIGERNIEAARATLSRLRIPILAEHVGGVLGRSLRLDAESFQVQVTELSGGTSII